MTNYQKPRKSLLRLLDPEQCVDSFLLDEEIDKLMEKRNGRRQGQDISRLFDAPVQPPHIRRSVIARSLQAIYSSTPVAKKRMPNRFTDEFSSISSNNGTECDEDKKQPSRDAKRNIGEVIVIDSSSSQAEANPIKKSLQQEATVSRGPDNVLPSSSKCAPRQSAGGVLNCSDQENAHNHHNSDRSSKISNNVIHNASKTDKPAVDDIIIPMPPPRTKKHLKVLIRQENAETETLTVSQVNKITTRSRSLEKAEGLKETHKQLHVHVKRAKNTSAAKESKEEIAVPMEDLQKLRNNVKELAEDDRRTSDVTQRPPNVAETSGRSLRSQDHRSENDVQVKEKSIKDSIMIERVEKEPTSVECGRRKSKIPTRKSMPRSKSDHRPDVGSKGKTDEESITTCEGDFDSKRVLEQEPQQGEDSPHVGVEGSPKTINKEDGGISRVLEQEVQEPGIEIVQRGEKAPERSLHSSVQRSDSPDAHQGNESAHEKIRFDDVDAKENERSARGDPPGRNEGLGQNLPEKTTQSEATPKSSSILSRGTPKARKSVTFVDNLNNSSNDHERVAKLPPPPQVEEAFAIAKSPNVTYRRSNFAAAAEDHRCRSEKFEDVEPNSPRIEVHEKGDEQVPFPPSKKQLTLESRRRKLDSDASETDTEAPKRMKDDSRSHPCDCKSKRKGKRWTTEEGKHHKRQLEDSDEDDRDPIWRRKTRRHRKESSSDSFDDRRATGNKNKISKYAAEGNRKTIRMDSSESDVEDRGRHKHETVKCSRREKLRETEKRYGTKQRYDCESESDVSSEREPINRKRAMVRSKNNVARKEKKRTGQKYQDDQRYSSDSELDDHGRATSNVLKDRFEKEAIKADKNVIYEERKNKRFEKHHGNHRSDSDLDEADCRQPRFGNKNLRHRKNGLHMKSSRIADLKDVRRRRPREQDQSYSSDSGTGEEMKQKVTEQRGRKCKKDAVYDADRLLIRRHDREDDMSSDDGEDDVAHQQQATADVPQLKNMVDIGTSPVNLEENVARSPEKGGDCPGGGAKVDEVEIAPENPAASTPLQPKNPKSERLHRLIKQLVERKSGTCEGSNGSSKKENNRFTSRKRLSMAMYKGRQLAPDEYTDKDRIAWLQLQDRSAAPQHQQHREGSYTNSESSTNSRLLNMFYTCDYEYSKERQRTGRTPRLFETAMETDDQFRFSWDDEFDGWETDEDAPKADNPRKSGRWRVEDGLLPVPNHFTPGATLKMGFAYRCEADILKDSAVRDADASRRLLRSLSHTEPDEESYTFAEVLKEDFVPKKISLTPFQPPLKKNVRNTTSKVYQKKKLFTGTRNKVPATKDLQKPTTSRHGSQLENQSNISEKRHGNVTEQCQRPSTRSSKLQQHQEAGTLQRSPSPTAMSQNQSLRREDEVDECQKSASISKSTRNRLHHQGEAEGRQKKSQNRSHQHEDKAEELQKSPPTSKSTRSRSRQQVAAEDRQRSQSPPKISRNRSHQREEQIENCEKPRSSSKATRNRLHHQHEAGDRQGSQSPPKIPQHRSYQHDDKPEEGQMSPSTSKSIKTLSNQQDLAEDRTRSRSHPKSPKNRSYQSEDKVIESHRLPSSSTSSRNRSQAALPEYLQPNSSELIDEGDGRSRELQDAIEEDGEVLSQSRTSANRINHEDAIEKGEEVLVGSEESGKRSGDNQNEPEVFRGFSTSPKQSKSRSGGRRSQGVIEERGTSGRSGSRRKKTAASGLVDGGTQTSLKRCNGRCAEDSNSGNCDDPHRNPVVVVERLALPDKGRRQHLPTSRRLDFPSSDEENLDRQQSEGRSRSSIVAPLPVIQEFDDHDHQDGGGGDVGANQAAKTLETVNNRPESTRTSTRKTKRRKSRLTQPTPKTRNSKRPSSTTQEDSIMPNEADNTGVRRSVRERRPPKPGMYRCVILVNSERQLKSTGSEKDVTRAVASMRSIRISSTGSRRPSIADRTAVKTPAPTQPSLPADPASPKTARPRTRKYAADSTVTDDDSKRTKGRKNGQRTSNKTAKVPLAEEEPLPPLSQDNDSGMVENGTMSVTSSGWHHHEQPSTSTGVRRTQQKLRSTVNSKRFRSQSRSNDDSEGDGGHATDSHMINGGPFEKLSSITYGPLNEHNKDLLTGSSELLDNVQHILVLPGGEKPLHRPLKYSLGFIVMDGNALVRIGNNYEHITKEERFRVPQGELYMIRNLSEEEPLKLLCIKN